MLPGFQPFASAGLNLFNQFAGLKRFCRTAFQAFLDSGTQCLKLRLATLLAFFNKAQSLPHYLASGCIASAIDEILDKALVVFADGITRGHRHASSPHNILLYALNTAL
ncbi:hypothetical protein BLN97_09895 [Bradyrhizobium elkanii]|nr:hypothetical protein BLN97_09895 [Bradyrhizobium elkanii]